MQVFNIIKKGSNQITDLNPEHFLPFYSLKHLMMLDLCKFFSYIAQNPLSIQSSKLSLQIQLKKIPKPQFTFKFSPLRN